MKNFIKPSRILTALVIAILALQFASVAFVRADVPVAIGTTTQPEPFESSPDATPAIVGAGVAGGGSGRDGNLDTSGNINYGITGSITYDTFTAPAFAIAWLDIKMSYRATAGPPNNDRYRIIAFNGASPVATNTIVLQDWTNYGEYIYRDVDLSGTVSNLDLRRTIVGMYAAATTVAAADKDVGKTLVPFNANEKHREVTVNGLYDATENVYKDVDASGTVTANDIRLHLPTAQGEFGCGTVVIAGDADVGVTLIAFTANEKHTEDWEVNAEYDYKDPKFELSAGSQAHRSWNNVIDPVNNIWTTADLGAAGLKFRIEALLIGAANGNRVFFYEIWLTIHSDPVPPANSVTIQPSSTITLAPGTVFFIDVVATNLDHAWGFTVIIYFDPKVVKGMDILLGHEYFAYDPFDNLFTQLIDNVNGISAVTFNSYFGDARGFTGDATLVRFYFTTIGGTTALTLDKAKTKVVNTRGGDITPPTMQDGMVVIPSSVFMSAENPPGTPVILPLPILPIGTNWHELFPHYSKKWVVTGWTDNLDGELSASDQLAMTNATGWIYQFHVDQVTTTIHWTFKPDGVEPDPTMLGDAEPATPTPEWIHFDPLSTRWHQIYPTYSRMFTITSWTDNGNGYFDPSDQFDFEYDDEPGVQYFAHLDAVSTDIILTQKPEPPIPPPVPEFPLGIGIALALAPLALIGYMWRLRKTKTKPVNVNLKGLKP